jgi:hypothetical protein
MQEICQYASFHHGRWFSRPKLENWQKSLSKSAAIVKWPRIAVHSAVRMAGLNLRVLLLVSHFLKKHISLRSYDIVMSGGWQPMFATT